MHPRRDYPTRLYALCSLLLACYFLLPGSQFGAGAWLDHLNFRLWSSLFPPAKVETSNQLQVVALDESITSATVTTAGGVDQLNRLLAGLASNQAAAVGIATDLSPLIWPPENVLGMLAEPGSKAAKKLVAPYRQLQQQLEQLPTTWRVTPALLAPETLLIDREFRWPLLFNLHDRLLRYYVERDFADHYQLRLFRYQQGQILAGFEVALLARARDTSSLRWRIPDQLHVGSIAKSVSMYGSVRPWPQAGAATALRAGSLQSDELSSDKVDGRMVLLADLSDPALPAALESVNAVLTNQYSYSPWWQFLVLLPLTLLLWAYGLFAFRRFTTGALLSAGTAIAALLSMLSIGTQAQQGVWLQTGDAIVYSLCLATILLIHSSYRNWQIRGRMEADDARLELARVQLEQNNPKAAADQLLLTAMSEDTAELMMEAGKAFERKRDYQSARDIYATVHNYFPGHSQAGDALADIASITGQHPSLSSTLILPDMPIELPQLGRYELIRPLGKGAMGAVYLANDPTIRRQVAIKTLLLNELGEDREELRDRFLREAETAGRLQHPNIATVFDVGEDGELAYIAMDYVPGGTLADWTDEEELLELPTLYQVMELVCDALAYAHKQGVVHRDIKPGNILYNPEDMSVKVTDFGIARLADYSRTKTGAILGSPYYMSPEQVSGKKVGPASDLYSLGVTFYQLLSGSLPFEADSLAQLAWQITNKPHRNVGRVRKGLPRSASRIVNTALKKDPGERFASAAEMGSAFQKGVRSQTGNQQRSA